jgi:hypothetical protein
MIRSWNSVNGIWHLLKSKSLVVFGRDKRLDPSAKWTMSCSKTSVMKVPSINTNIPKHSSMCICIKCLSDFKRR